MNHHERDRKEPCLLTAGELEVLTLLASGLGGRRTGLFLKTTQSEVGARLGSIRAKMGVSSNTQAVMKAIREGILEVHRNSDVGVSQLILPPRIHGRLQDSDRRSLTRVSNQGQAGINGALRRRRLLRIHPS